MSLATLQAQFQQHLLTGDPAIAPAVRAGGIGTARRLAVYYNAYRMRLLATLRDTYGHTLRYLGDEAFDAAGLSYVEAHPSGHASLRNYGDGFDAWLAARFPEDGEAAELAMLDLALRRAFDGPDAGVLGLADLAGIAPDVWAHVGFELHPTALLLQMRFNTLELWHALDREQPVPPAVALPEAGDVLIWRRGHQPHFRSVRALEAAMLDWLQRGLSFAAACEWLGARFTDMDVSTEAGVLLRRWVDEELLSGVTSTP